MSTDLWADFWHDMIGCCDERLRITRFGWTETSQSIIVCSIYDHDDLGLLNRQFRCCCRQSYGLSSEEIFSSGAPTSSTKNYPTIIDINPSQLPPLQHPFHNPDTILNSLNSPRISSRWQTQKHQTRLLRQQSLNPDMSSIVEVNNPAFCSSSVC